MTVIKNRKTDTRNDTKKGRNGMLKTKLVAHGSAAGKKNMRKKKTRDPWSIMNDSWELNEAQLANNMVLRCG